MSPDLLTTRWGNLIEPTPPDPLELFSDLPVGEDGRRWELAQSPWVTAVFEWWLDPTVEWIYLIQGSQTSKTTTMMGLLLYAAQYAPGPAFWVGCIEDEVDKFVVQRLKPFLEEADEDVRTGKKVDWRRSDLRLYGRMLLHCAWATSGKKLRAWPCRYVFGDETGVWPEVVSEVGNPLAYVKKRTRRYRARGRKGIFATTPSTDTHPAWTAAQAANFGRWYVPCPECGVFQYLDFNRVRFGHCKVNGKWDMARVGWETFYECEGCGARLTDADKSRMVGQGRLQYIDPKIGEPAECDLGNTSRTLQVPATYSLFTPWGELARSFLEAQAQGPETLRIFITDETAEPWRQSYEQPTDAMISTCIDDERGIGEVPEDMSVVTAGVDVHANLLYYVVRAWGPEQRSALIRYGMLPREKDQGLSVLDEILHAEYGNRPVALALIDAGYDSDLVYSYCAAMRATAPSKGGSMTMTEPIRIVPLEPGRAKARARARRRGFQKLYIINTDFFKSAIHKRLRVQRGDPREWRLPAGVDEEYCRQILSEARTETISRGRRVPVWKKVYSDNHYFDCEVLAAAAAWLVGAWRNVPQAAPAAPKPAPAMTLPDGRPFLVTER